MGDGKWLEAVREKRGERTFKRERIGKEEGWKRGFFLFFLFEE